VTSDYISSEYVPKQSLAQRITNVKITSGKIKMISQYIFWWSLLTLSLTFYNCRESSEEILELGIDLSKVVANVDPKFLSVAIGSRLVAENWKNFDFKSTKLLNMAKALSPAYFRLGGTSADLLYFKKHHKSRGFLQRQLHKRQLSRQKFNC
jgi:hypothetical protein